MSGRNDGNTVSRERSGHRPMRSGHRGFGHDYYIRKAKRDVAPPARKKTRAKPPGTRLADLADSGAAP
jgi:hypothetical protein